jgi:hypothetical protein
VQPAIIASGTANASYTFQVSPVALTTTPTTNIPAAESLVFAETANTNAPDGLAGPPIVNGATNGTSPGGLAPATWVCATTQALPAQPSTCKTLSNLPAFQAPLGLCASDGTAQTVGHLGPTLTIADVGANATYNVVACKDFMTWSKSSSTVSFTAYSHTVAMTGAPADFLATEQIAAAGGNTADVSWDATNLYLGLTNSTLLATDYVQFYVGSPNGTGVQTADNLKPLYTGATPTFAPKFNALYHGWWKVDNTDQGLNQFAGSWQTTTNNAWEVKYNNAAKFVEFAIPLADIATAGTTLYLLGGDWVTTGGVNAAEWPSAAGGGNAGNSNAQNWTQWQTEFLSDGFAPNDPNNLGNTNAF